MCREAGISSRNSSDSSDQKKQPTAQDAQNKRQRRVESNRQAAKKSRQKRKDYVDALEKRILTLESVNASLSHELRARNGGELPAGCEDEASEASTGGVESGGGMESSSS